MPVSRFLVTAAAVGVAVNVYDFLVHGLLLQGPLYSHLPLMRTDMSLPLLVVTDFVAALVFVWVYQRARPSFGAGPAGGAVFGLYAGVLVNFPTWIGSHLLLQGFTYGLAWAWTLAGVAWGILAGAVAGALAGRPAPASAAA
jgi:hypothetical protein